MAQMTEIVEAANHIPARFKGLDFRSQAIQTLTKGGIDPACALCLLDEGLDHRLAALHDVSREVQLSIHSLLENLHNGDIGQEISWGRRSSPLRRGNAIRKALRKAVT